jgi:hypothetical protein
MKKKVKKEKVNARKSREKLSLEIDKLRDELKVPFSPSFALTLCLLSHRTWAPCVSCRVVSCRVVSCRVVSMRSQK